MSHHIGPPSRYDHPSDSFNYRPMHADEVTHDQLAADQQKRKMNAIRVLAVSAAGVALAHFGAQVLTDPQPVHGNNITRVEPDAGLPPTELVAPVARVHATERP